MAGRSMAEVEPSVFFCKSQRSNGARLRITCPSSVLGLREGWRSRDFSSLML